MHKDFKDFLSSARLWSPKRGSAAVEQPCSRALPFVSFVPNSLPCHPGFHPCHPDFHPCHPGFIWTACLANQAPIFASFTNPSSHPFSCKHLADLVFISKSVLFCPSWVMVLMLRFHILFHMLQCRSVQDGYIFHFLGLAFCLLNYVLLPRSVFDERFRPWMVQRSWDGGITLRAHFIAIRREDVIW